jgi:hypothetical protein
MTGMGGWLCLEGAGRRGFRRYENGKIEANGFVWAASQCPNRHKSEIVVIFLDAISPLRQLSRSYAQSCRDSAYQPTEIGPKHQ